LIAIPDINWLIIGRPGLHSYYENLFYFQGVPSDGSISANRSANNSGSRSRSLRRLHTHTTDDPLIITQNPSTFSLSESVSIMARSRHLMLLNIVVGFVSLVSALSYAPKNVTCPANLIRYGDNGLSPLESQYISQRRTKATQNLQSWLERVNLDNFDVSAFLANQSNVPTLAFAFSGGGYRAMLNGAGVFQGIPLFLMMFTLRSRWTNIGKWKYGRVSTSEFLHFRTVGRVLAHWSDCSP